ncbi:MAG TPA: translation initiation factor IF-2 N-terminal domain-containing protein, partial [Staphylococcus saprophyticus]|nr:translation initiation factor IF-2 N-terminal domain-containing protein [Staphylococcus saprophyticus]
MSKQRIYEYAKELNLKSKDVIDELKKMNVEVSNHMQALEDDQIAQLNKKFKPSTQSNNKANASKADKPAQNNQKQQQKNNQKPNKNKKQQNKKNNGKQNKK